MLNGKMLGVMDELGATIFSINQSKTTALSWRWRWKHPLKCL